MSDALIAMALYTTNVLFVAAVMSALYTRFLWIKMGAFPR